MWHTKITELEKKLTDHNHDKYIIVSEFNNLAAGIFNVGLAQANFLTKTDYNAKLTSFNKKITSNKTKHLIVENELKKLKTFDSSYFIGKSHFEEDGTQNYLVFQPMYRYFKGLLVLVVVIIFIFGNLKDCLMKILQLLLQVITNSIQNSVILVLKQE